MRQINRTSEINPFNGKLVVESELYANIPRGLGLLYEAFENVTWQTWADFCTANPQFAHLDLEMQNKDLILGLFSPINRALINRFHRVKSVTINSTDISEFYEMAENFKKLTSIRKLTVANSSYPIFYITSRKIKILRVDVSTNREPIDCIEPVLKISRNIEEFSYISGILDIDSMTNLQLNPINKLELVNVGVTNQDKLVWLFEHLFHLTSLTITGELSTVAPIQTCFFLNHNTRKEKIKYLELKLYHSLFECYTRLGECPKLEHIKLSYNSIACIELIYRILWISYLPKLTQIDITPFIIDPSGLENMNDQSLYNTYQRAFYSRGITLNRLTNIIDY